MAISEWSPGPVSQIALHPVAGMDQPFTAPRLMAILMSSVREATPEFIGLAGVVVVLPMRGYLRNRTGRPHMGLIFSAMARPQFRELITRLRVFARDFSGLLAISESVMSSPRSNGMGTPGTRSGKDRHGHRSGTFTETDSAELAPTYRSAIGRLLCHP